MSLYSKFVLALTLVAMSSQNGSWAAEQKALVPLNASKKSLPAHANTSSRATLEAELKKNPDNAEAHLMLGQMLLTAKNYDQAKIHLKQALKLGRGNAIGQKANIALLSMPRHLIKPKTGSDTRVIASMLGLGRSRGAGSRPTVIDFYASWCQPCKQLDSVIGRYKSTLGDKVTFMRVDVDDPSSQNLLDQYEVSPIPTVVYLNDEGEVVTYSVGFSGENTVKDGINKILSAKTP